MNISTGSKIPTQPQLVQPNSKTAQMPKEGLKPAEGKPAHLPGKAIKELTKDCCEVKKPGHKHQDAPVKEGMKFPDKPMKGPDCDKGANVVKGSVKSGAEHAPAELKKKMQLMKDPNISEDMKSRILMNMDDPARYEGMKKIQPE